MHSPTTPAAPCITIERRLFSPRDFLMPASPRISLARDIVADAMYDILATKAELYHFTAFTLLRQRWRRRWHGQIGAMMLRLRNRHGLMTSRFDAHASYIVLVRPRYYLLLAREIAQGRRHDGWQQPRPAAKKHERIRLPSCMGQARRLT